MSEERTRGPRLAYQEDLAHLVCGNPECTETHDVLYLHGRCHPTAGTWTIVMPGANHVHVVCARCEAPIMTLAIAARPPILEVGR